MSEVHPLFAPLITFEGIPFRKIFHAQSISYWFLWDHPMRFRVSYFTWCYTRHRRNEKKYFRILIINNDDFEWFKFYETTAMNLEGTCSDDFHLIGVYCRKNKKIRIHINPRQRTNALFSNFQLHKSIKLWCVSLKKLKSYILTFHIRDSVERKKLLVVQRSQTPNMKTSSCCCLINILVSF